jgi:predicted small lipoprotein YifL
MRIRAVAAILATLFLPGCWWQGPVFYPPDRMAAQPLTPGLYEGRSADPADKPERIRLTRFASGSWGEAKDAGSWFYFIRLPGTARDLWIMEALVTDSDDAGYGLIERSGDHWTMEGLIPCRGTQALVRAAGGTVTNDDPPGADGSADRPLNNNITCTFADRASLERALKAYADAHPQLDGGTLTRIGD